MHYMHTYTNTQSYTRLRICITSIKEKQDFLYYIPFA